MSYARYEVAVNELYKNLKLFVEEYKNKSNATIVVFGTSKIAGMIIYYLRDNGMDIDYIIDNQLAKQGKKVYGVDIYSPNKLKDEYNEDVIILIASMFQNEMITQMKEMGYKEKNLLKIIDLPMLMSDYSFVDRTGFERVQLDEIKKEMLRVLKKLKSVCEEHNLKYWLYAGTFLGAVRHKGFIPWDDDIDVYMEIKDMKKLSEILKNDKDFSMVTFFDKDNDYYDAEITAMYSEKYIMDTNHFPMQCTMGVDIDIFPLVGAPDNLEEVDDYIAGYKELEMKMWARLDNREECQKVAEQIYEYLCTYDFYKSKYVVSTSNGYSASIAPQEYYLNSKMYEFEGDYFVGPDNYDYILSKEYGDYMVLPPEDKRTKRHEYRAYKQKN